MRSGMKWLFALAMFVAIPAGCLTEEPGRPQDGASPALSAEEQPLEETLRCPGGLVDCCGDGTCTLPQVCKYTQCASEEPKAAPVETQSTCGEGLVECCGPGWCVAPEICHWTQCES